MAQAAQQDFIGAVKSCLSKYGDFSGRAPRAELWWWVLFVLLLDIGASLIGVALDSGAEGGHVYVMVLRGLASLAVLLPGLAVAVRRLHDIDKSGWWLLIGIIPFFGALVLLIFYCLPGMRGANRFGPDPLTQAV